MESLLNIENLHVKVGEKEILKGLNLKINKGETHVIMGPNGAGKSTLMKTLLHLKSPISGHLHFGEGVSQKDIGYLPQQNQIQKDFPATVQEVVLSGCQSKSFIRPFYNKKEKAIANLNIQRMELKGMEKKCFSELSGGQQQRVLLARALCSTEKILLLDEPVAGLDPHVGQEMYSLIEKLNKEFGITIIMISHDIGGVLKYATHILHLGEEVFYGTKDEYVNSEIGQRFIQFLGGK